VPERFSSRDGHGAFFQVGFQAETARSFTAWAPFCMRLLIRL